MGNDLLPKLYFQSAKSLRLGTRRAVSSSVAAVVNHPKASDAPAVDGFSVVGTATPVTLKYARKWVAPTLNSGVACRVYGSSISHLLTTGPKYPHLIGHFVDPIDHPFIGASSMVRDGTNGGHA